MSQPTATKVLKPCCVSGQSCQNPAGTGGPYGFLVNSTLIAIPHCFRCGEPVCEAEECSKVVDYEGNQTRLCADCLEEIKRPVVDHKQE